MQKCHEIAKKSNDRTANLDYQFHNSIIIAI